MDEIGVYPKAEQVAGALSEAEKTHMAMALRDHWLSERVFSLYAELQAECVTRNLNATVVFPWRRVRHPEQHQEVYPLVCIFETVRVGDGWDMKLIWDTASERMEWALERAIAEVRSIPETPEPEIDRSSGLVFSV